MSYLKAGDTISGQEAVAKMTIHNQDGTSSVEDMFYAKSCEGKCELEKTDVKVLGKRGKQHKPNGWNGTGNMTIYYVTTRFRQMAIQYIKTGVPVFFDMLVTNNDPGSSIGPQTTLLKNCNLDTVTLAKFDVDAEVLDETVDFTFDDAELLDSFGSPILGN
jgi:hypothetical protein